MSVRITAAAALLAVLCACGESATAPSATTSDIGDSFSLRDQTGRTVTDKDLLGKPTRRRCCR